MNVYPMRCARTVRYKYILNLHPEFEYTTHMDRAGPQDGVEYWQSWVRKARSGRRAEEIVWRYHARPREELYDTQADPHETRNLAGQPEHRERLTAMRRQVEEWMKAQGDEGRVYGQPRLLKDRAAVPS